jgi:hypothetical protein
MTSTRTFVSLGLAAAALCAVGFVLFHGDEPVAPIVPPTQPVVTTPKVEVEAPLRAEAPHLPTAKVADNQRAIANFNKQYSVGTGTAQLFGEVVDAISKRPVSQYTLVVARAKEGDIRQIAQDARRAQVWHNKLGTFIYKDMEPGLYNLHVQVLGYETKIVTNVDVPSKQEKIRLELSRGAYVEGRVVDDEDEGIGGIDVRLRPLGLDDPGASVVAGLQHSDDDGYFLFTMVPPGTYEIALGNQNLSPQGPRQVYVAAGQGYTFNFAVPEQNDITITVTDQLGNRLHGATVSLWSGGGEGVLRGETDETGEVNLHPVPPGTYTVKVWRHQYKRILEERNLNGVSDEVEWSFALETDPRDYDKPTPEELERLKNGEREEDVYGPKKPTQGGG